MSFLDNFAKNVSKGGRSRTNLTLAQVLVALSMADEGVEKDVIADALGMSKHQLNYKIFEKQATFSRKDKEGNLIKETKCRSIMRHLYEDHTDPNSKLIDGETFAQRLFEAFGEEYIGPESVDAVIDQWKADQTEATA